MRVLLISANTVVEPYPVYPLGLDYVAGAISDRNTVSVLDLNQLPDGMDLSAAITEFGPDAVGVSLRNVDNTDALAPQAYIDSYRNLIHSIRQITAAPIILGGSGFTIFPNEFMQLLEADYGICGEGERLAALLEAIEHGQDPTRLPGVWMPLGGNDRPEPWTGPVSRGFDAHTGYIGFYLDNGGMLNLQTKRGCPFRCIYCSYPSIEGRKMRLFPPEQVAQTAKSLEQAGARYLFIADSAFNADPEHSVQVARAFQKHGLSIPWGGFFAPMSPSADYYTILADSGLKHVEFGTESLADEVLKSYRKPFSVSDVFQAHQAALDTGVHVAHYFLFGGPGETQQSLDVSFSNIDKLERTVLFIFCGMRIYPQTALYEIAVQQGQIESPQSILAPVFFQPPGLPLESIAQQIETQARGRINWVTASSGNESAQIMRRMYAKGYSGPLWEYLIRAVH